MYSLPIDKVSLLRVHCLLKRFFYVVFTSSRTSLRIHNQSLRLYNYMGLLALVSPEYLFLFLYSCASLHHLRTDLSVACPHVATGV